MPLSTHAIEFAHEVQTAAGDDVAVAFLSYSLCPQKHYPEQVKQAISLVAYLVNNAGKNPENVILCIDMQDSTANLH